MAAPYHYTIKGQNCWLSADRLLFWEEEAALIVSDLHFGKTGHFRKEGIAVPQNVYKEDLQRLVSQIQHFQPRRLIVVGDMFHSRENKELDWFKRWRNDFAGLDIVLAMGNHDILREEWYVDAGVSVCRDVHVQGPFSFAHDIALSPASAETDSYCFSGHFHPGVRISGGGRQALRFPCFYFTPNYCVLPAFSRFTGMALVQPGPSDKVFAIVNQTVIPC